MTKIPTVSQRRLRRHQNGERQPRQLHEETRHGITAVILFVLAGLSGLSFFDLAGPLGYQIDTLEGVALGWLRYAVPVALVAIGGLLLSRKRAVLQGITYLGLLLLVFGLAGLFHVFYPTERFLTEAAAGNGGGYIGYGVAWPLLHIAGRAASLIILFALFLIGTLVTFNTSFARLGEQPSRISRLAARLQRLFGKSAVSASDEQDGEEAPQYTFAHRTLASPEEETKAEQPRLLERTEPDTRLESYHLPKPKRAPKLKTSLPLDLLQDASTSPTSGDVKANTMIIKKALENFGIQVEMGEVNIGPTVTQYTLKPAEGVKLAQIVTLANDLALALAAHPIRIEAPIPGKSLVGVEVPNKAKAVVSLKEILGSEEFRRKKSSLTIALGKDVAGHPALARLDAMPHLLIAGATGSGKSVCINSIIISLLYQNSPDELKFILVDPKRVELTIYNDIPHLITPVITDVKKTVSALKWTVAEMDRRYHVLSDVGARNIGAYNSLTNEDPLPYIVVVIDELADLMAATANEVEGAIVRLAQIARAVGIHLIVATQRPSVDVITGLIKANITSRIAFSVASLVDSRTIIDSSGAEKLLGRGDMLYVAAELSKPRRLQGALVSDAEIERVVTHLKQQADPEYEETVVNTPAAETAGGDGASEDDLYDEAKAVVLQAGKASASLLQRRLRVGYARAARLLDILEEQGVIGPLDGARPREVLVGQQREQTPAHEDTLFPPSSNSQEAP